MGKQMTKGYPKQVIVAVRDVGGTYMARAAGMGITASCTGSPLVAANRCANKVYPKTGWSRETVARMTYRYSPSIGG